MIEATQNHKRSSENFINFFCSRSSLLELIKLARLKMIEAYSSLDRTNAVYTLSLEYGLLNCLYESIWMENFNIPIFKKIPYINHLLF